MIVATTHLESGACSPADLRAQQLKVILGKFRSRPGAVILAGDLNLRAWEAVRAKIGGNGGAR